MTMPLDVTKRCFVCGSESPQTILASSNTFGGTHDLDTRPPEMMRSTMHWWIQECPHCGYISYDLESETKIARDFLKSDRYTTCAGRNFQFSLAEQFYRQYLILLEEQDAGSAFSAALNAAWACDDCDTDENAVHCRLMALEQLDKVLTEPGCGKNEDLLTMRADLLRRTRQFDRLIAEYADQKFENDLLNKIIAFQLEKAKNQDTLCYRMEDVPGVEY